MALSSEEIKRIHLNKLATPGKKYYGDDEEVYVGTSERRLRVLDKASVSIFKPTEDITSSNVQDAIEEVEEQLILAETDINTLFEDEKLFINTASTGVIEFDGLSIESNTLFGIGAIKAWFIDSTTDVENPTKTYIEFDATTGNTVPDIATQNVTYIGIDVNGLLTKQGTPFTPTQSRTIIQLGVIVHSNRVSINAINNQPEVVLNPANQLSDLMESIGFFNINGNVFSANGVNLNINKTAGFIFKEGINFVTDNLNPHTLSLSALTAPTNIRYRLSTGTEYANTAVIDPDNYDNGGVLTAIPGTRFSIQRIYVFQSNLVRIQYGQATYTTLTDAIQAITSETFTVEQNLLENGLLRGLLIVRKGTTDLTDTSRALFIEASKFGGIIGLGSVSTSTMQQVYNNSAAPQITTTTALGSVQIKRGSAADTDNIIEGLNGAGTTTFEVDGNGKITSASTTASEILGTNASKEIVSLPVATYPSLTELSYVKGVVSSIQTQLDAKIDTFEIYLLPGQISIADATTYYYSDCLTVPSVTAGNFDFNLGFAFTITGCIIGCTATISGTAEVSTLQLHNVTQATSSSIGTFATNGSATVAVFTTFTGLNIVVAATDFIEMRIDTATLVTNPTAVRPVTRLICKRS